MPKTHRLIVRREKNKPSENSRPVVAKAAPPPPQKLVDPKLIVQLARIKEILAKNVFEREHESEGILLAIISGTSAFFYGPPGTAKTYHISMISKLVGLSMFDILMSESTKPDSIFGPSDIPQLVKGIQVTKTTGYAPSSNLLFFDEIFKANAVVLNPLLWLINEHKFRNGDLGVQNCPVKATFAASNEIPTDTTLAALYDRLILRYEVSYLKGRDNLKAMVNAHLFKEGRSIPSFLTQEQVEQLRDAAWKVQIPDEVEEAIIKTRAQVQTACGIEISDRRLASAFHVVQAYALMNGRDVATIRDIEILANIFWNQPEQQTKVKALVLSNAKSNIADLVSYVEMAEDIWQTALQTGNFTKAETKLEKMYKRAQGFKSLDGKKISDQVLDRLTRVQEYIAQRNKFHIFRLNDGEYTWYKVSVTTAMSRTPAEMRSIGFHWRRVEQYWWHDGVKLNKEKVKKYEEAMISKIKTTFGVAARIKSI